MYKKVFSVGLAVILILGCVVTLQPISFASADYACGTYSADVYSDDCATTDSTPIASSNLATQNTLNTNGSSDSVAAKTISQFSAKKTVSQPNNWVPWAVAGAAVILAVVLIVRFRPRVTGA
jgi:hypothetical protein